MQRPVSLSERAIPLPEFIRRHGSREPELDHMQKTVGRLCARPMRDVGVVSFYGSGPVFDPETGFLISAQFMDNAVPKYIPALHGLKIDRIFLPGGLCGFQLPCILLHEAIHAMDWGELLSVIGPEDLRFMPRQINREIFLLHEARAYAAASLFAHERQTLPFRIIAPSKGGPAHAHLDECLALAMDLLEEGNRNGIEAAFAEAAQKLRLLAESASRAIAAAKAREPAPF